MDIHQKRLAFLEPNEEAVGEIVYPEFKAFFSINPTYPPNPHHHGLFDPTPEQISHGVSPLDKFGWSRDGVI